MFWIIASVCIVTATAFWLLIRRGDPRVTSIADVATVAIPVDLEAFRLLLDQEEASFLRSRLPVRTFRMIQRQRLRAALAYTGVIASNASVMIRVCQLAASANDSSDVSIELLNAALLLRLRASMLYLRLATRLLWPGLDVPSTNLLGTYAATKDLFLRLVSVSAPSSVSVLYASV